MFNQEPTPFFLNKVAQKDENCLIFYFPFQIPANILNLLLNNMDAFESNSNNYFLIMKYYQLKLLI